MGKKSKHKKHTAAPEAEHDKRDADLELIDRMEDSVQEDSLTAAGGGSIEAVPGVVDELKAEVDEFRDKYLRALAELENTRKRNARERSELLKYQGETILAELVGVLDNFEYALANPGASLEQFKQGIELIHKQFVDLLGKWEVRAKSGVGTAFDPAVQLALSEIPMADMEPGQIVSELKKAYYYKDKLLRPGEVVVSAKGSAVGEQGQEGGQNSLADAQEEEVESSER
jgi:molecular chaperone GrpE